MSKKIKQLICWWRGHDEVISPLIDEWECRFCGKELSYHECVTKSGGIKYRLKCWLKYKKDFFKKCEDCGQRFGKHNDKIDHPPF